MLVIAGGHREVLERAGRPVYEEKFGEDQKSNGQVGRPDVCNHSDGWQQLEETKRNILLTVDKTLL